MKKSLTGIAMLLCCALKMHAQTLDASQPGITLHQIAAVAAAHLPVADTGEGGSFDRFRLFNTFWQDRAVINDSSGHTMFQQYYHGLYQAISARRDVTCSGTGFSGNWQVFGPDSMTGYQEQGKTEAIWADPTTGDTVLAGCTGGLFKSTDGGNNWRCVTDNTQFPGGTIGICHIAVNPQNHNTIFLGTGMHDEEYEYDNSLVNVSGNGYGAGILESFDGGNTWSQEFIPVAGNYNDTVQEVQRIFFTPDSNRIYAFCGIKVYTRSNNPVGAWVNITPQNISPNCAWWDLQFVPDSQNHFFISNSIGTSIPKAGIWESHLAVPDSTQWTKITAGFSDYVGGVFTPDSSWFAMDMSIPDNDTLYFIAMGQGTSLSNSAISLYKYNITGSSHTITRIADDPVPDYNSNQYKFKLIVSPAGTSNNNGQKNMYIGLSFPYQSHDGGLHFTAIGQYGPATPTHGDIRDICLQTATNTRYGNGDVLFFATDGGVSKKPAGVYDTVGETATINISGHGLTCGEFWGIGMSWDGRLMVGGEMHDGIVSYEQGQNPPWVDLLDLKDASTAGFDNTHSAGVVWEGGFNITESYFGREMGAVSGDGYIPDVQDAGDFTESIYIDPAGNQYAGMHYLWKQNYDSFTWFNYGILHGLSNSDTSYIHDMVFSPYDTNLTGYVLYYPKEGSQYLRYRNPSALINNFQAVVGIPGVTAGYPMTCITMDPKQPQKVWVGLGAISSDNTNRVNYSPNAGGNWYDVSSGLPLHVPVSKMVYQEGSSDVVYCATDAGIYRCDFSTFDTSATNYGVSWTCFNTGMVSGIEFPNIYVTALKINYCQNKLYAATLGRSIFVSDLPPSDVNPTDTITTNTTWTTNQQITTGIDIKPGVTFTIKGDTVFMPKYGVISVEPGAHLIVDSGAVITNSCDQCMWQGIEAKGHSLVPQTVANQGWVTIKNGSVIQHAITGVANYDHTAIWGSTGGIIQAVNSTFLNCHNSVSFEEYDNSYLGVVNPNLSYFTNCTFVIDNNYKGDIMNYPMNNMVRLHDVEGIGFVGCQFLNRDTAALDKGLGVGIQSFNSGFSVGPYCLSMPAFICPDSAIIPSRFCGFVNAISVQEDVFTMDLTVSIDHTIFDSSGVGVYVSAQNNVSVTQDTFNIGSGAAVNDLTFICQQNIGIYTQNVSQFRIEANNFHGSPSGYISTVGNWYNIGVAIANTGSIPPLANTNTVYRNTLDSLTNGIYYIGDNYGSYVFCNHFTDNTNDIFIASDIGAYWGSIHPTQGAYPIQSAGNTFVNSTNNIVNTTNRLVEYYYDTTSLDEKPANNTSLSVSLIGIGAHNTCTPTFGVISAGVNVQAFAPVRHRRSDLQPYKDEFFTELAVYQNASIYENSLIDFGATDSLLNYIDTVTDTNALYKTLMVGSPFLSNAAVEEAANYSMLVDTAMVSVLEHNPELMHDLYLDNSIFSLYSFSDSEVSVLASYAFDSLTARTVIEDSISNAGRIMDNDANIIMMALKAPIDTNVSITDTTGAGICTDSNSVYYMLDSNSAYTGLDSVDTWLQNIGDQWTYYARTGYYNKLQQYAIADSIFLNMPPLSASPVIGLSSMNMATLWSILYGAETHSRDVYRLDSDDIAALDTTSVPVSTSNTAEIAVINITGLINGGLGHNVTAVPCIDEFISQQRKRNNNSGKNNPLQSLMNNAQPFGQQVGDQVQGKEFSVFPNPANGIVTFSYNVPNAAGDIRIVISNVLGEQEMVLHTGNNTGSILWDPRILPPGMYIYQATTSKGIISTGKLVLAK